MQFSKIIIVVLSVSFVLLNVLAKKKEQTKKKTKTKYSKNESIAMLANMFKRHGNCVYLTLAGVSALRCDNCQAFSIKKEEIKSDCDQLCKDVFGCEDSLEKQAKKPNTSIAITESK